MFPFFMYLGKEESLEIPEDYKQPCRKEKAKKYRENLCKHYGINEVSLKIGVSGKANEGRRVYQYLLREELGNSLNEIAKEINQRDYRAVAKAVSRVRKQIKEDKKFAKRVKKVKKS